MTGGIYLDYNATAPLRPDVRSLMLEILNESGNASSVHRFGRVARARLEKAREQTAALAGTKAAYVTFTAGATEANNAVLQAFRGGRILVSAIEHSSVLDCAPDAERIPVTADGLIDEDAFERLISAGDAPALVSVMLANNETGAVQPVERLARLAKRKHPGVFFHTDAVQAAGKIPIDFPALHVDYMSLSAHKFGGPQGAGALIAAPGAKPVKLIHGGGQEKSQRAGTENIAAIAGFGLAAERALAGMDDSSGRLSLLRDRIEREIARLSPQAVFFAAGAPRIPNTLCFALPGCDAQTLLMALDLEGVAVSSGSACSSGVVRISHVLRAMDAGDDIARGALRVSLGWNTSESDIDGFAAAWSKTAARMKGKETAHA